MSYKICQNEDQLEFALPALNVIKEQGEILLDDKRRNPSRYQIVVKSNLFIKEARYYLPALQQRILLLFISKIKPEDSELLTIKISIKEIADTLGIAVTGGSTYTRIRKALKELRDSSWFIKNEEGETLFSWLDTYTYSRGMITVKLSESLKPYLIDQSRDFTKYQLLGTLALKSKYSIRLYEMLLCDTWKKCPVTYDVEKLRSDFAEYGKLMEYKNFKKLVLLKSIAEINRVTDIEIDFKENKEAGSVKTITFFVRMKEPMERMDAEHNALQILSD